MSDNRKPYEAPSIEEIETAGYPIETMAGISQPPT
jgi:hypothetical protein